MNKASERQVGGQHYAALPGTMDHWSYCDANDVPYLESACTKYVVRWRKKNGVVDLHKALHYLEKRIENYIDGIGPVRGGRLNFTEYLSFVNGNGLDKQPLELEIVSHVLHWSNAEELEVARLALLELIEQAEAEPSSAYVNQD